jgi:hypothetical protein
MPSPSKQYTYDGVTLDLDGWAKRTGINKLTLSSRLLRSWSYERVFTRRPTKPVRIKFGQPWD